jgi:predicted secreted protein
MKVTLVFIFMCLFSLGAMASQHQHMGSVGASAKGQFIALEEYGYNPESHSYYVTIRIINVWTSEDVGSIVAVETPAKDVSFLEVARSKAKNLAKSQMDKYKIISI